MIKLSNKVFDQMPCPQKTEGFFAVGVVFARRSPAHCKNHAKRVIRGKLIEMGINLTL
jgi:hypothetical protein